jgi:hypothetical protein
MTWPKYPRETLEDLDVRLGNYGEDVPAAELEVQVLPFPGRPVPGGWQANPHRISGLTPGRYAAWTRWNRGNGAKVIDYVGGDERVPSFEVT